jgi:putative nucleotidyltransferase with HDIG domain
MKEAAMQILDDYINKVKSLPPAPRLLPQLLQLLNEEDVDAGQVVDLITFDPGLTAKLLQRCNSAASGLSSPVHELSQAVALLGFNEIYRLVAVVIGEGMLRTAQRGYGIDSGELWRHSATAALAAKGIAEKLGADADLAFTAALLHDIGKLVLNGFLEGAYEPVLEQTGASGKSFVETEKSILGVEHAEVGGRVLARWCFPESLVRAVWYHHDPAQAHPYQQLAGYVYLADLVAHCLGQAQGIQSFAVRGRPEVLEMLEITPGEIEGFILQTSAAVEEAQWIIPLRA